VRPIVKAKARGENYHRGVTIITFFQNTVPAVLIFDANSLIVVIGVRFALKANYFAPLPL
jgi:hypothetical protein